MLYLILCLQTYEDHGKAFGGHRSTALFRVRRERGRYSMDCDTRAGVARVELGADQQEGTI